MLRLGQYHRLAEQAMILFQQLLLASSILGPSCSCGSVGRLPSFSCLTIQSSAAPPSFSTGFNGLDDWSSTLVAVWEDCKSAFIQVVWMDGYMNCSMPSSNACFYSHHHYTHVSYLHFKLEQNIGSTSNQNNMAWSHWTSSEPVDPRMPIHTVVSNPSSKMSDTGQQIYPNKKHLLL